jgi:hypothetical protein
MLLKVALKHNNPNPPFPFSRYEGPKGTNTTIFKFPFKFDINGLKFNIKLSVKMYVDLNNVFQELEGLL